MLHLLAHDTFSVITLSFSHHVIDIVAASNIIVITNSIKQNEDPLFTGEPIIGIVITVGGTISL